MANEIRIKRRAAGGAAGAPTTLANAELAFNEQDDTLYYGKGTGGAGGTATQVIAIGGPGAFQSKSSELTSVAGLTTTGLVARTASGTHATRSVTGTSGRVGVTNGDGVAGNPTIDLATSGVTAGTYTKITVDAYGRATTGATASISDLSAPTAAVSFGSQRITSVAAPTAGTDAANKDYVDLAVQGLDPKQSVKAATTAALTATLAASVLTNSGTLAALTLDGVTLAVGDRVLVKDQAAAAQNGIYTVTTVGSASVAWVLTRSADMSVWTEVPNAFVFVEQGTTNGDNGFLCTSDTSGTIDTTAINWVQFTGASQVIAGNGLTKSGNTLAVVGTTDRIVANADSIDLATTGITAGTYKSLTIDAYGRATAGTNPTTLAGYGITDAAASNHNHSLDSLSNVTITSNASGEILKWNGTAWINNTLAEAGIQSAIAAGTSTQVWRGDKTWVTLDMTYIPDAAFKKSVRVATTANLTATFASGVLTNSGTLAALALDGITLAANDRVLVKDQTTAAQNGIYTVTNVGSASVAWVLTRAVDADSSSEIAGALVNVDSGTANGGVLFTNYFKTTDTINTSSLVWSRVVDTSMASSSAGAALSTTAAIGTSLSYARADHVHPIDATLAALAGVTTAANTLIYATGVDTFTTTSLTAQGRALLDDADAAAQRTTLGLSSMATQASTNVSITGGSIQNLTTFDGVTVDGGTF